MITSHLLEVLLILLLRILLARENHRRDRIQAQKDGGLEGRDLDATSFSDLTDGENMKYVFFFLFFFLFHSDPLSLAIFLFRKERKRERDVKTSESCICGVE